MSVRGFLIIFFISLASFGQNRTTLEHKSQYDYTLNIKVLDSLNNQYVTKDFVLGKFDYKNNKLFTEVNPIHTSKTIYLNKEVYLAFLRMNNQAKSDGITLKIISGTRNFAEQKFIWERKWRKYSSLDPIDRAKKILEYSSMPSTSRHHWGTELDLNSLTNSYFEKGQGKKDYEWLLKNANNFGFFQVYTDKKNGRTGYNLERWHWSYLPLANKYLSFYNNHIHYSDILDFNGFEQAKTLSIILNYVNGISENSIHITSSEK